MRIGMISTPFIPVPPPAYGGTELIVAELVEGLRALGHEVVLYTVGEPDGDLLALYRRPVWPPDPYHEVQHAAWAISDLARAHRGVDVVHTHCAASLPLRRFAGPPFVYTIHHNRSESHAALYAMQRDVRFVAISERQRWLMPEVHGRCEVVHHGVDPNRFPLGPGGEHAVFLGRLSPEKGPHIAVDVARRVGVPLRVAGRAHPGDEAFFAAEVAPRLAQRGVEYLGEVDFAQKVPLLSRACATLFPIHWEEPFGLVMIESMLCGTPVLAFAHGAVPEVVEHGVTGFVCADVEEMAARLISLSGFDRARCRARTAERFGRARMVRDYLAVYERAARAAGRPLGRSTADEVEHTRLDEAVPEV